MKRIDVAIGIVVRDRQVLICQRHQEDPLGGFWEFPGGKVEPGESAEQCVARELQEELGIKVRVHEPLAPIEYDYPNTHVRLFPFLCSRSEGEPQPLASQRLLWVNAPDLPAYRFPPANDDLIRSLVDRLSDGPPGPPPHPRTP